jgi:tetratricopeptide (TPR) repeat protein
MKIAKDNNNPLLITIELSDGASFSRPPHASLEAGSSSIEMLGNASLNETMLEHMLAEITLQDSLPLAMRFYTSLPEADQSSENLLAEAFALLARNAADRTLIIEETALQYAPSNAIRAEALRTFIAILPIEELFPNNAWASFQDESLAACYQVLAAYFIKLQDFASAEDCLRESEALDASPRTLALRGLISRSHGETLGAVAHMVSSLQQYEQRKAPSPSHYVSFQPKDIEVVNIKLKDGLDALNRKDNEEAFNKFSEAVFNFDEFFASVALVKQ